MQKKLFFMVVVLSLVLIGNVNAHEQDINQNITQGTFKLRETSTFGRSIKGKNLKNYYQKEKLLFDLNERSINIGTHSYGKSNNHLFFSRSKSNYNLNSLNRLSYFEYNKDTVTQKKQYKLKDEFFYYGKQFVVGELCGIICSFGSLIITGPFLPNVDPWTGAGYVANIMSVGYIIGNSLGVYLSGNKKYHGSYFSTLIGSISGAAAGVYVFYKVDAKGPLCSSLVIGPTIGSIIGFNLSRKPRELPGSAFINFDNDKLRISPGGINLSYDYSKRPLMNINLIEYNF